MLLYMDIKVSYMNIRSVNNKSESIAEQIIDEDIDICVLTETWLRPGDKDQISRGNLTPEGYKLFDVPRPSKRGGGVAIVCKSNLKPTKQPTEVYEMFEHMEVLISTNSDCVRLCVLYRPPSGSVKNFLDEFSSYIDQHSSTTGRLLILGDFNFHLRNIQDRSACSFRDLLFSLNLDQHVQEATHDHNHTLDLVITKAENNIVNSLCVRLKSLSDHYNITFNIPWKKPLPEHKTVKVRKLNELNMDELSRDIEKSDLLLNPPTDLDELVACYNDTLSKILNQHAPVQDSASTPCSMVYREYQEHEA